MNRSDLDFIRQLNDRITGGLLHIAELKSKAYPGAIVYDDIGGSHPMPSNKIEMIYCLIDQEEKRINRLIDKRYALKRQAIREIQSSGLDTAQRHILYLRYLSRDPRTGYALEWSDVRRHVMKYHNISERRVYQLHHMALAKLTNHKI